MRQHAGSVRVRTTLLAIAIVGAAMVVGGVVMVTVLRHTMTASAESEARLRADDIAGLVKTGALPRELPGQGDQATVVQVVDESGRVIGQSPAIHGDTPLLDVVVRPGESLTRTVSAPPVEDPSRYRVVAVGVYGPSAPMTVFAGASLEPVDETSHTVIMLLTVVLPALLLVVGATTWWLVGRTLEPIDAMRREAAEISAAALDRRIPEPAMDDEVGRLARTLNEMLARLDESNRRQRAFVADASHELRSPHANMRAQLEAALAQGEGADWPAVGARVLHEEQRVEHLVDDLLLLARTETLGPTQHRELVDLDEIVLREVEPLRARGQVRVDLSDLEGGRVYGDPDQLRRLVRNLLDNAERHAGSVVSAQLGSDGAVVELVVADDGPGIADADRERVFERFTRLDDVRGRETGGAGLGLAIVREVAEAHGGSSDVMPATSGAWLRVRLPAAARLPDDGQEAPVAQPAFRRTQQ